MGEISSWEEINFELFDALFKKRGYKITKKDFLENVKKILKNEKKGKVVQCRCGELIIFTSKSYEKIRTKINDNNWCKRCRDSNMEIFSSKKIEFLDDSIRVRTAKIEKLLKDFEFDVEDKEIYCPEYKLKKIKELGDGLFPANNIFEFQYGYSFFGRDWNQSLMDLFDRIKIPYFKKYQEYEKEINKLVDSIYKLDAEKTNNLLNILEPEKIQALSSINRSREMNNLIDNQNQKNDDEYYEGANVYEISEHEIDSIFEQYCHSFELQAVLDLLKNVDNIISGNNIITAPFKKLKIDNSKFKQVEHLTKSNLPKEIKDIINEIYDNKLRNAHHHNQYLINTSLKKIELTYYNETRTFAHLFKLKEYITTFHTVIFSILEKIRQLSMIDEVKDWGIDKVELFLNKKNIPSINIHQYTYFINKEKGYFPAPKIFFSPIHRAIEIIFGSRGFSFYFPYEHDNIKWLETLLECEKVNTIRKEIAPKLNQYKKNMIETVKLEWDTCYVLNITQQEFKINKFDLDVIRSLIDEDDKKSPLSMNFNIKIETKFDAEKLRELQKNDLIELKKRIKTDKDFRDYLSSLGNLDELLELPIEKQLRMDLKDCRSQEGIFYIKSIDDEDYELNGLFFKSEEQVVFVKKRNIKEKLKGGEYIKAKIIAFISIGRFRSWDFIEVYKPS